MDTGTTSEFFLAGQVSLDFGTSEQSLVRNLSGCVATGPLLWTVSDEGRTLERLTREVDGYRLSERFALDQFIQGIPGSSDDELDLESIDSDATSLWLCGAHCKVRRKPEANEILNSEIRERKSRRLLARLMIDQSPGRPVTAQSVPFEGDGSLRTMLEGNLFFAPFRELPTKENGIDIEGLAVVDGCVFIGLRGPVIGGFAVVAELAIDSAFRIQSVRPFFLNLQGLGVRELTRDGTNILITAGPVGDAQGPFALYRWSPKPGFAPRKVYSWGTAIEKPEGLCWCEVGGERGLLVFYDSPGDTRLQNGVYSADLLKRLQV
ncbi:DUF3616 domain-containing protein [Rhizobium ruizarguesonis]|jgi:hypothetical protein|uniref:DUF3616 domain-containing protein n=1 Tax=Rhizobium ruizarguesonis TaxID=2081791 RepID=UPI0010317707|nr:DUF3616 domain-containing protein [Rhizobium ruizarguesonis]NEI31725.1 DUF3616 domain-containing protein [Rhizobium ruizarguesonis]TBB79487.1 DUF3616 domain-containing protein [Rhizobium ruizarguesonis]